MSSRVSAGRRSVALDPATVAALRQHRTRQLAERLPAGEAYEDGDLVVCLAGGTPVHPKSLSYYFEREVRRAGLPPIRLHDLRHTRDLGPAGWRASAGGAGGLGHTNVSITLDTYSHVDLDMQAAAAVRVAALVAGADQ